jgi:hypothetical protein
MMPYVFRGMFGYLQVGVGHWIFFVSEVEGVQALNHSMRSCTVHDIYAPISALIAIPCMRTVR